MRKLLVAIALAGCTHAVQPLTSHVDPSPPSPAEVRTTARRVITDSSITILDTIGFVGTTSAIDSISFPLLDAVVETLSGNPSIALVEVQATGNGEQGLADDRAHAIVGYLVTHGVEAARLRAHGIASLPHPASFVILKRI
jgi:outer membrane protein OmpA-like peptidoglycan-associated protein